MPITTEEEIFLIYSAVYQWNMCDKEVYGEVIRRLHARIYALMFSANLETLTIKVQHQSHWITCSLSRR